MHKLRNILALFILLASSPAAHARGGGPLPPGEDPLVPGFAIVRLNNATLNQFLTTFNQNWPGFNAVGVDAIAGRSIHLIQFQPPPPAVLDDLEEDLEVTYVNNGQLHWGELLYEGQAPEGHTGTVWVDMVAPNAAYLNQYAVSHLNLGAAHERSTGVGTVIAVLDTGLDSNHPLLEGRIVTGGYNFIANSTNTADVGDGLDNDGDGTVDEMTGHGTFVAGLIALVAPGAKLLPITVLNTDGVGDSWSFAKGMFYAIDRGVEVINLSLGSTYDSEAVLDAAREAKSLGIIVAAAAGNMNQGNNQRVFPAMEDEDNGEPLVFGTAALDHNGVKARWSNYNKRLFISAPGDSTGNNPNSSIISAVPGAGLASWEGTSMATPLVSGSAALIRSQHPQWTASVATFHQIRLRMAQTAVNIYPQNPQYAPLQELGVGRINAGGAVALGPVAPRLGDLNADGVINVNDLLTVINQWGLTHTSADITGDGIVNVNDLLFIINNWG